MSKISWIIRYAAFGFALTFTFSCSGSDNGGNGGGNEQSYNYCITADNTCLVGPFTVSACNGQVSNSCPNDNGGGSSGSKNNSSSSSRLGNSSSSSGNGGSSSSSKNNSSSSSRSSSNGDDILGSCTGDFLDNIIYDVCIENVPQAACSDKGGTFSSGVCNGTSYPYCLGTTASDFICYLIGSENMPTKADCPQQGNIRGTLLLSSATCGGSIGSCVFTDTRNGYGNCLEIPQNLCSVYQRMYQQNDISDANVSFNSSECNTSQYPCCFSESLGLRYIDSGFSKNDCFSKGGRLQNAATCDLYSKM